MKRFNRKAMENVVFNYFNTGLYKGVLLVIVHCVVSDEANDCLCPQQLNFNIDGAGEFNLLGDLLDTLEDAYNLEFEVLIPWGE